MHEAIVEAETSHPRQEGERRRALCAVVVLVVAYVGLRVLAPHLAFRSILWSTLAATIVFMMLSIAIVLKATKLRSDVKEEIVAFLILTGGFGLCNVLKIDVASDVALMLAAVAFGKIVSRLVRHPNLVLPVAVVAGLVDIWGVNLGGPVSQIAAHAPRLLDHLSAKIPSFSGGVAGAPKIISVIGVGDFAFLALFFACLAKFGMNTRGSAWLAGIALCVGMAVVTLAPVNLALPGLPFMAVGILLPNRKHFQFSRSEKFAMLYAGVSLIVVLAGMLYGVRSLLAGR